MGLVRSLGSWGGDLRSSVRTNTSSPEGRGLQESPKAAWDWNWSWADGLPCPRATVNKASVAAGVSVVSQEVSSWWPRPHRARTGCGGWSPCLWPRCLCPCGRLGNSRRWWLEEGQRHCGAENMADIGLNWLGFGHFCYRTDWGGGRWTIYKDHPPFLQGFLPCTRFALPATRGKTPLNARDWWKGKELFIWKNTD